jgi:hypothetical protein
MFLPKRSRGRELIHYLPVAAHLGGFEVTSVSNYGLFIDMKLVLVMLLLLGAAIMVMYLPYLALTAHH